ncbi:unnamed protein product [Pelagomonas calceolata]|uniref:MYND-type domain-containing protein n=1 Tax=Pelagomonas calceolata TaxID=35677 RepID=A0A8J2X3S9_9STRA|nr:unnamed protein product [Pelagomonas calceolata]
MILTTCAACAAPLAHDAPRCVRCHTRYCNKTCQHDHWRRGHKQMCKKIHRGGNAEQYHADKKYKEAVAVAVEACADDTNGEEDFSTLRAAINYMGSLIQLQRSEEAKALYRKTLPVARRVLGESHEMTLGMRTNYAMAFCADPAATLDDLREALTILEETARTARRVFGGAHPSTRNIEGGLRQARARFALRELLGQAVPGELAPPEPQLAAAATPFAAASAIAGHLGMDPQEANAAIEELSELKARDPEAFAELMQAALSGEGADAGDQDP